MKNVDLRKTGNIISMQDIEVFEENAGVSLPDDYKEFLLKNNGGYPVKLTFTPDFSEADPITCETHRQSTDVEYFFPLNEIAFEYEDMLDDEYIPSKYIPISRTSFGNLILICTETNGVYFANHDLFDTVNEHFTISKIADSFSLFMDMLYPADLKSGK